MTRDEIMAAYHVENGIIRSPGKYEAEPIYAPYFHNEMADDTLYWPDDGKVDIHLLNADDYALWPEIGEHNVAVTVEESDQGFVTCTPHTQAELDNLHQDHDHEWEMHEEQQDD